MHKLHGMHISRCFCQLYNENHRKPFIYMAFRPLIHLSNCIADCIYSRTEQIGLLL